MVASSAHRLVVIYATLWVLLDLAALLPGNPDYSPRSGAAGSFLVQALVAAALWHGSRAGWVVGLLLAALGIAATVLIPASADAGSILLVVIAFTQIAILIQPAMLSFVWSRGRPPKTVPSPQR